MVDIHRSLRTGTSSLIAIVVAMATCMFGTSGCDESPAPTDGDGDGDADVAADADADGDSDADGDADDETDADGDSGGDATVDADAESPWTPPVPDPPDTTATNESRARAFQLYYRERVERAVIAYNRFAQFGDATFSTNIGNAYVARTGDEIEIIPGPCDNNRIGMGTWTTYQAYRVFRSRSLELTLLRQFNGLVFFEAISGHAGVTSREVYPGWTLRLDGPSGTAERTRFGEIVTPPMFGDTTLEEEVLATFFSDVVATYRMNPEDFLLNFMPMGDLIGYAITYSFIELPDYLRVSDCCSSLMRTPDEYTWAGAFWGNHNSRDNFPDLALGYIAALAASRDVDASTEVREAAERAIVAGQRIGDLILDSDTSLMTVDEHNSYDTLISSGTVRPDGETENQDLGSFGVCSAAYLAQAISTEGLSAPAPELPLPGSLDRTIFEPLDFLVDCELPDEIYCTALDDAWCGHSWSNFHHLQLLDRPILEFLREYPDAAPMVVASFQDDFDEMTLGMLSLVHYADVIGDDELYDEARSMLFYSSWLMGELADLAFPDRPERRAEQRYHAALYQAQAALPPSADDLSNFDRANDQMAQLEALLSLSDTAPAELRTDEEIQSEVEERLASTHSWLVDRYRAEHGETVPVRRSGDGYEARGTPLSDYPWQTVERPRHARVGGFRLLHAISLCERAPQLLDCEWAVLGCERPDLNADTVVDVEDRELFDTARTAFEDATCDEANSWCDGADLDRDGDVTEDDEAFMVAAQGCTTVIPG